MTAGTHTVREERRDSRPGTGVGASVVGTLALAAGYGLVVSVLIVLSVEHMFGSRGAAGRLTMLAATVGVLVAGAGIGCARRRRRPAGR